MARARARSALSAPGLDARNHSSLISVPITGCGRNWYSVSMFTLEGKSALVCGSTQGIGKACAMECARLGARVTLMARHPEALEKVLAELPRAHKQKHDCVQADFS